MEPFIPAIVRAIDEAFSVATASTFLVGIVAAIIAAGVVLLLREAPQSSEAPQGATADVPDAEVRGSPAELVEAPVPIDDVDDRVR